MTDPTQQGPQVDMEQVTAQTVQQLGAQNAMLTLELNAQMSARAGLERTVAERDEQLAERDAELGRVRQTVRLLQDRVPEGAVREPVDHEQKDDDQVAPVGGESGDGRA